MGTTTLYRIQSRKEMVAYLKDEYLTGNGGYRLLDSSQRGNILYGLVQHPKGLKFIAVIKMVGPPRGYSHEGWGYKDMDESMGPCYYDCPERILAQSEDTSEWGTAWRQKCRDHRKRGQKRRAWAKSLQSGDTVEYLNGQTSDGPTYKPVTYVRNWSDTFFVGRLPDEDQLYRLRWAYVKTPESKEENHEPG